MFECCAELEGEKQQRAKVLVKNLEWNCLELIYWHGKRTMKLYFRQNMNDLPLSMMVLYARAEGEGFHKMYVHIMYEYQCIFHTDGT